ncbi:MAG: regulator SirB [Porticoccaceae bacterium]|nr:regulator SirB [Porticoccaceae bacterium]
MTETYLSVKFAHMAFALISIAFFAVRAVWSVFEAPVLSSRWVRVSPHVIDTLLLACAVYLMVASGLYPFQQPWLTAKLLALIVYILLGTLAIKRGKTPLRRGIYALLAVVVFGYILAVAFYHSPLLF